MPNRRAAGTVVTSVALPAELLEAVRVKAAGQGLSVSEVIRRALVRFAASDADDVLAFLRGEKSAQIEWRDPEPMPPEARVVAEAEIVALRETLPRP